MRHARSKAPRLALMGLLLSVPFFTGCNMAKFGANTTSRVLAVAAPATDMESDPELARQAAPGQLKTVEGFHLAAPDNDKLLYILAKGYCGYTFGFLVNDIEVLEDEGKFDEVEALKERSTKLFTRCMNYGLKLTGDEDDWKQALYGDLDSFKEEIADADADEVPGLYFTGLGLANMINLNRDNIEMVAYLPKVEAVMKRVVELDESYFNGGAHMGLGMMYCARGAALGGKPEEGMRHFDRAIELTGGKFLLPKVLKAKACATITQNKQMFHDTLVDVLMTSPAVYPEQRLPNELAHIRAKRYLAMEKEWF